MQIDTQNTPNSARSHYDINSVIHIHLITTNNASLSHNSTHVRLLQERTLNDPDFPRHHTRSPPVKVAISHGDHKTAKVTPNHCLQTVSCTIYNPRPQPISDVYYAMCTIATLPPPPPPPAQMCYLSKERSGTKHPGLNT